VWGHKRPRCCCCSAARLAPQFPALLIGREGQPETSQNIFAGEARCIVARKQRVREKSNLHFDLKTKLTSHKGRMDDRHLDVGLLSRMERLLEWDENVRFESYATLSRNWMVVGRVRVCVCVGGVHLGSFLPVLLQSFRKITSSGGSGCSSA
jgi:hypothetical protein